MDGKLLKYLSSIHEGFSNWIFIDLLRMETLFTLHKKLILTMFLGLSLQ